MTQHIYTSNFVNIVPDNNIIPFRLKEIPVRDTFHIKLNSNGDIKQDYLRDLKYRSKIINMDKELNQHIFEIFNWDMVLHLHDFKISYKSFSKYIIDENTNQLNIELILSNFINDFKCRDWVLSLGHHKIYKKLGFVNIFHPKYSDNKGRPQKYFNEDDRDKHRKIQLTSYNKSIKGKISNAKKCKKYRDKQKFVASISEDDY